MLFHDGAGLAAPQVHRDMTVFLTNIPKQIGPDEWGPNNIRLFINPKIIEHSEEEWLRGEGCLSIPELYSPIWRPLHIKVEATDINGNVFTEKFSGLQARAVMHENDHINGVLFIDRVRGKERQEIEAELRAIKKKYFSKKK